MAHAAAESCNDGRDIALFSPIVSRFGDGNVFVPPGEFVSTNHRDPRSGHSERDRVPMLHGLFDGARFRPVAPLPCWSAGYGSAVLGPCRALVFGMQAGPDAVYWLADASDSYVWDALERWHEQGAMVLAAEFQDGTVVKVRREFELDEQYRRYRATQSRRASSADDFARQLLLLTRGDDFRELVTSHMPRDAAPQNVQFCMVCTPQTPQLRMSRLHRVLPRPMAESLRNFLESALGITDRKH